VRKRSSGFPQGLGICAVDRVFGKVWQAKAGWVVRLYVEKVIWKGGTAVLLHSFLAKPAPGHSKAFWLRQKSWLLRGRLIVKGLEICKRFGKRTAIFYHA
jgi:hypothetical protein